MLIVNFTETTFQPLRNMFSNMLKITKPCFEDWSRGLDDANAQLNMVC